MFGGCTQYSRPFVPVRFQGRVRWDALAPLIFAALADVSGHGADNGLRTGVSVADMVPAPNTPEELVSRNSESISGD